MHRRAAFSGPTFTDGFTFARSATIVAGGPYLVCRSGVGGDAIVGPRRGDGPRASSGATATISAPSISGADYYDSRRVSNASVARRGGARA